MSSPTVRQLHVDRPLTNISIAYMQDQRAFVAGRAFPMIPVDKRSDLYYKFNKDDFFRDIAKPRASGTESAGGNYDLGTDSYVCVPYALHKDVADQDRENTDAPLDLDRQAVQLVTRALLLRKEVDWASKYFATSIWATDVTGVSGAPTGNQVRQWNDYTNSNPINDIESWKEYMISQTGYMPNKLVLSYPAFRALKSHPRIIERIQYVQRVVNDDLSAQLMAELFGLDEVLVSWGVKTSSIEGATVAMSFIFGKHALLCYSAPTPGLMMPSAGYSFGWRGVSDGMGETIGTRRFRMEHLRSDRIESENAWDHKVVATDLGIFFSGVVA